jgi:putative salt-induced outer membrane protein
MFLVLSSIVGLSEGPTQPELSQKNPDLTLDPVYGWSHLAEASFLQTSGNTSVTSLGAAFETRYRGLLWASRGRAGFVQNTVSGLTQAELFTVDLRGDRNIDGHLGAFLQGSFLRNPFAGFNSRTSGDVGVRYEIIPAHAHVLAIEAGLGALAENRTDIGNNTFANFRGALDYQWRISPTAELSNLFTVLDNLNSTNDVRLTNTTSLGLAVTSVVSAKLSFRLDYLNSPVAGKKNLDTATTVALAAKF